MPKRHAPATKLAAVTICALSLAAASGRLFAQAPTAIPAGQIVCNFFGRLDFDAERHGRFNSYFTSLPGIPTASLFAGDEASDKTARFTIVSTPIRVELTRVGLVLQGRTVPVSGETSFHRVYYNEVPIDRGFDRPGSFAEGQLIATFRARNTMLSAIPLLPAQSVAILELESSRDFAVQGRQFNIAQFGNTVRTHFFGGPTPSGRSGEPTLSFPVSGYAVAVAPSAAQ